MGIKADFRQSDILKQLVSKRDEIENGIVVAMKHTGEEFFRNAKTNVDASVYDRVVYDKTGKVRSREPWELTGNLRASIGYFILKDGIEINNKLEGTSEGMAAARSVLNEIPKQPGYWLIGVAGMNYASNVESYGYDVITNAKGVAIIDLQTKMKQLEKHFSKKGVI